MICNAMCNVHLGTTKEFRRIKQALLYGFGKKANFQALKQIQSSLSSFSCSYNCSANVFTMHMYVFIETYRASVFQVQNSERTTTTNAIFYFENFAIKWMHVHVLATTCVPV